MYSVFVKSLDRAPIQIASFFEEKPADDLYDHLCYLVVLNLLQDPVYEIVLTHTEKGEIKSFGTAQIPR